MEFIEGLAGGHPAEDVLTLMPSPAIAEAAAPSLTPPPADVVAGGEGSAPVIEPYPVGMLENDFASGFNSDLAEALSTVDAIFEHTSDYDLEGDVEAPCAQTSFTFVVWVEILQLVIHSLDIKSITECPFYLLVPSEIQEGARTLGDLLRTHSRSGWLDSESSHDLIFLKCFQDCSDVFSKYLRCRGLPAIIAESFAIGDVEITDAAEIELRATTMRFWYRCAGRPWREICALGSWPSADVAGGMVSDIVHTLQRLYLDLYSSPSASECSSSTSITTPPAASSPAGMASLWAKACRAGEADGPSPGSSPRSSMTPGS
jgi:hypothetical protein